MRVSRWLTAVRWPAARRAALLRLRDRYPAVYRLGSGVLLDPPYQWRELAVGRMGALGDVLLCTPGLREAHRRNPRLRVTFYTDVPAAVAGLPYVHAVRPYSDAPPGTLQFTYEECAPPRRHIARLFADPLGLTVRDVRPDVARTPERDAAWAARLAALPRPWVVVNRKAGPFTPNKDWPAAYWADLLPKLAARGSVIEIGAPADAPTPGLDLRGRTDLADLIAVLGQADLHVGPISGPVHIAAAVRVPAVVIYGGYENAGCSAYPGNINLVNRPACSPCWLPTPCPHDRKCLAAIPPAAVLAAADRLLAARPGGAS